VKGIITIALEDLRESTNNKSDKVMWIFVICL